MLPGEASRWRTRTAPVAMMAICAVMRSTLARDENTLARLDDRLTIIR